MKDFQMLQMVIRFGRQHKQKLAGNIADAEKHLPYRTGLD
jgi:hypothetical protein